MANGCEWCGTLQGPFEVDRVRKLKDLKTKAEWEVLLVARQPKTMLLCKRRHVDLRVGRLSEGKDGSWRMSSRVTDNDHTRFGLEFRET